MTKSLFRIPPGALDGHIRYRFGFLDGLEFLPPQTGEQRARLEGDEAIVDICGDCGPTVLLLLSEITCQAPRSKL